MLVKKCSFCGEKSYSSTDKGNWICPYCGMDISRESSSEASAKDNKVKDDGIMMYFLTRMSA